MTLSLAYKVAAWVSLAGAVFLWAAFVAPAIGFYLGGFLLRREGL